jgi:hypothetical protein
MLYDENNHNNTKKIKGGGERRVKQKCKEKGAETTETSKWKKKKR